MDSKNPNTNDEKSKMLRVDSEDFDLFEKLLIDYMINHDKLITRKQFFGELVKNAIKKGSTKTQKNTLSK